jgi:WhiB family redox-sensing transcriptional regulator
VVRAFNEFGWFAPGETAWMLAAGCRDSDPELFFPVSEVGPGARQVAEARAVCAGCPVQVECLAFALERDLVGVWGATTEDERRLMRRADRRVAS